jgi:uncharacterized protein
MMQKLLISLLCLMLFFGTAHADSREKLEVVRLKAEQGNAQDQNKLGVFYEIGLGINQDDLEAVKWYRLAAEQGYAEAQFNLGEMYEEGRGVTQDKTMAKTWYEKACKNGWECGCKKLLLMNDSGCGE